MMGASAARKLWDRVTVFDGSRTWPEAMALVTGGERIERLVRVAELGPDERASCELMAGGGVITPGLVDCHTHLVFAGQRAAEFEQRLKGVSYAAIAAAGGGILSTVRATRAASEDELVEQTRPRLEALIADGVTTVEIKSGYGLSQNDELKMLRAARRLGAELPVRVLTTFLGAHALPPEFVGRPDAYIDEICKRMLPAVAEAGLADAVDVFCEHIAFTPAQCERVFEAATRLGLPVKIHAEQLSNQHGSALAARFGALSADHLEWLDEAGVAAMAEAGMVATLLPGAFLTLKETRLPPIQALRDAGVPMAVASDGNPGSSPMFQLTLMLNLACTLFGLTPTEALQGITRNAARALGLQGQAGELAEGRQADFCLWRIENPVELAYAVQSGRLRQRVVAGRITHGAPESGVSP
ncbi:MAG: imidazolonepropionase [Wenzhouxiangella sp.]|nr:MAG: imidazolonepropionase [Wenzhouxiangella sp.]